jgi:hypothetical protein
MKYLKLFEEFKGNRIKVTSDERKRLREISRIIIKHCQSGNLTSGIHEKYTLLYDLGELKNLIGSTYDKDTNDFINQMHKDNGYKIVDDYAKKLSNLRGTEIIFDRENGCFITKSGKAMTTVNIHSEFPNGDDDNTGGYRTGVNTRVFVNYETGDIINDLTKEFDGPYIGIFDFSGDNIIMSINQNIRVAEMIKSSTSNDKTLLMNIFSTLYHELIHSKDPLAWSPGYLGNTEIYGAQNGGFYASHDSEVQSFSNQFLELIEYYFERTLRGDTDGNGVNYNLRKEDISDVFIPNILEIVDFVNGNRDELSERVVLALSGTNKTTMATISTCNQIVNMRTEDPEDGKVIRQWMRDDFTQLVDYYNTRVIEINKRKERGQELPLLHKGFPFEVTELKPTPKNVDKVTTEIENRPPVEPRPTIQSTPAKPTSTNQIPVSVIPAKPIINREPAKPTTLVDPFTGRTLPPNRPVVNKPVVNNSIDNTKFKFASNSSKNSISKFDVNELIKLVDKYINLFPTIYSKCLNNSGNKSTEDIKQKLQTLFRELKTKDTVRIKDSVKSFFDEIGSKLSDENVKKWLKSSDGRKWGESISNFEQLCSMA